MGLIHVCQTTRECRWVDLEQATNLGLKFSMKKYKPNLGNRHRKSRELPDLIQEARRDQLNLDEVVVVDSDSFDGSDQVQVRTLPIRVIRNHDNRGFAQACNQFEVGFEDDYLFFLDRDTRVDQDSLEEAIDLLEKPGSSNIGITGVQLRDEDREIERTCAFKKVKRFRP